MKNSHRNFEPTSVKRMIVLLSACALVLSCNQLAKPEKERVALWEPYNDSAEVAANADHEKERMRYKLIQSKVLDKNDVFGPLYDEVKKMSEAEYRSLKKLVMEQDIPTIQNHITAGKLTYEKLALFYLYRIYKYELDNHTTLNTVIALNENVVGEARKLDEISKISPSQNHPIYGMPILLKDNINYSGIPTTAGAIALEENYTEDSYIVKRIKANGGLILGKVNLSEWAYFFCGDCPVGYSAIGGQTLNPYGRRVFETGGSSSGSGTSVAANYAVGAVGTETSGSILSPSSQNSVVGLKPTVGLLSRTGIVPISSTLDTPGPMTKNVIDNAILLDAMLGFDNEDRAMINTKWGTSYFYNTNFRDSLRGKRLGAMKNLVEDDSLYSLTIEKLKALGAEIVEFSPPELKLGGFITLLNIDMKNDLPKYMNDHSNSDAIGIKSVADVVDFNRTDSLVRAPYGQALFEGILKDSTTFEELEKIKLELEKNGRLFFKALEKHDLDAVLSINNYHAGYAAVAKFPALTVPMGYKENGEPISLTFISKPLHELSLLKLGRAFEKAFKARKAPKSFE